MSLLFHTSDLHFGRADEAALAWFAARVAEERPDAVIVTGDLTQAARPAEFAAAAEWLARLDVPLSIEPGNHDLPVFNPFARFVRPYGRFRALEAAVERPLDLPDVAVVPLKTTARAQWRWNWAEGRVGRVSLESALAALRNRQDGRLALVACHHPLVDLPGMQVAGRTRGGAEALAALAGAGADAVLSGHVHDGFDHPHPAGGRTVRLVGAGTLSERRRGTPPSFNRLRVEGGTLIIEQIFAPSP
jgi:3',5'-cyclic AMP phosphodiesterase CpdA